MTKSIKIIVLIVVGILLLGVATVIKSQTGTNLVWLVSVIILILYILFILLTEGDYIYEVFKNSTIKWNF